MSIIPYEKITLRTQLSSQEVIKRISESSEYIGNSTNTGFNVSRAISYQNSFLPQIKGLVVDDGRDTKIEITMKLNTFVLLFMVVWLGGMLASGALALSIITSSELDISTFIPIIGLIFGALLFTVPFKLESKKSKKDLINLFEAERLA